MAVKIFGQLLILPENHSNRQREVYRLDIIDFGLLYLLYLYLFSAVSPLYNQTFTISTRTHNIVMIERFFNDLPVGYVRYS